MLRPCTPGVVQNVDRLCCGMMFDTRGAKRAAGLKVAEASTELLLASQMGKLPVGKSLHAALPTWQNSILVAVAVLVSAQIPWLDARGSSCQECFPGGP